MGRRPVVPEGDDFLPGVSPDDIRRLMKKEKDPKNYKKYLVAYNRKAGRTINEIAEITGEPYENIRRWVVAAGREGLAGIPRRIARGADRKLTRRQRVALARDVHAGPRKHGYKTDVWTYRDLWLHAMKRFGVKMGYSTAVRNFHEMKIVIKVPRPRHPKAASEEERAEFQRNTRKEILKYARLGFVPISEDEAHIQTYRNEVKTLGLSGIEPTVDSSVERARLTVFGGAGDGFFYLKEAPAGNGTEFIKFCERIFELFGKAQFILDFASYHLSRKVREFVAKNAHRLKLHFTLKYTPNDNVAEAQWPAVKAAVANKPIRSRGHIAATIGEAFDAGEMRPVAPYPYTRVATRKIGRREAGAIRARIGRGEHFCYEETQFNGRVAIPTAEDLKGERESVLPPEKRAMLPHDLANSGLPDKFLASAPPVLLAE